MTNKLSITSFIICLVALFVFAPAGVNVAHAGFTPTPEPTSTSVPPTATNTIVPPTSTQIPATSTPIPAQPTATNTLIPAPTNTPTSGGNNPQPAATSTPSPTPQQSTSGASQPTATQALATPVPRAAIPANPPAAPALGEGYSLGFLLAVNGILLLVLVGLFFAWRAVSKTAPVVEPSASKTDKKKKDRR